MLRSAATELLRKASVAQPKLIKNAVHCTSLVNTVTPEMSPAPVKAHSWLFVWSNIDCIFVFVHVVFIFSIIS